jgi:hypothetical protein
MNKIFKTTLILTVSFLAICSLHNAKAQCKVDGSNSVKGEFSINGTKVQGEWRWRRCGNCPK